MPARFVKSYQSPDGQVFTTLEEEQAHELKLIVCGEKSPTDMEASIITTLMQRKQEVADCLRQKERKNLRTPKVERKPRAPKAKPETT